MADGVNATRAVRAPGSSWSDPSTTGGVLGHSGHIPCHVHVKAHVDGISARMKAQRSALRINGRDTNR